MLWIVVDLTYAELPAMMYAGHDVILHYYYLVLSIICYMPAYSSTTRSRAGHERCSCFFSNNNDNKYCHDIEIRYA